MSKKIQASTHAGKLLVAEKKINIGYALLTAVIILFTTTCIVAGVKMAMTGEFPLKFSNCYIQFFGSIFYSASLLGTVLLARLFIDRGLKEYDDLQEEGQ